MSVLAALLKVKHFPRQISEPEQSHAYAGERFFILEQDGGCNLVA